MSHDALMVLSFGGPEAPDDVMPFLRNVVRGRNVPDDRLAVVAEQYELFGGISPINEQNRSLIAAIEAELDAAGFDLPIYFGNRNWSPYVADAVQQMADDGVRSALVFVTSAFGSYSGCRQYREDLEQAASAVPDAPDLHKLRLFYNHPGFIEAVAARVATALDEHHSARPDTTTSGTTTSDRMPVPRLVFTAHSIPVSMAANCDYEAQLREAARLVVDALEFGGSWDVVFQSRSGPPHVPWLEPDIGDHIRTLAEDGDHDMVVVPLGFVSDHMEVLFDLDTQATAIAAEVGVHLTRAATVGTHPRFVEMIRALIEEQVDDAPKLFIGADGPWPDPCPTGHCLPTARPDTATTAG